MSKNRTLVNDQDTYDYTTPSLDVVARPTDPYVAPSTNNQASQIVGALTAFQSGLQSYSAYRDVQNKKDKEEGALARAKDPEAPLTKKTKAFIEGWESLDGELKAKQDYYGEVNQYLVDNAETSDKDEFIKGLQKIGNKYTAGATKNFLKGFVDSALNIEDTAVEKYFESQATRLNAEKIAKTNSVITTDIKAIALSSLNQILGTNAISLEDIQANPELYGKYLANTKDIATELSQKLREYLSKRSSQSKALQISTKQISSSMLDIVGTVAEEAGIPELLDYVNLKDTAGVAVSDTDLKENIRTYKNRAEAARNDIIKNLNTQAKVKQEQSFNLLVNTAAVKLFTLNPSKNPEDMQTALKIYQELSSNEEFLNGENGTVRAVLNLAQSKFNINANDESLDRNYLMPLYQKYVRSGLTADDILKAIPKLSLSGEGKAVSLWNQYLDNQKSGSKTLKLSPKNQDAYNRIMQMVNTRVSKFSQVGNASLSAEISYKVLEKIVETKRDLTVDEIKALGDDVGKWLDDNGVPDAKSASTEKPSNTKSSTKKRKVYDSKTGKFVEVSK
jgi:hypothetical protein